MATATPTPTPNPNAMKFVLDVRLPAMINVAAPADAAAAGPFAEAVLAVPGVANLFGTNDFVTVTRQPDAAWEPIVAAVQAAAAEYL
jgi:hypothetical protein